MAVFRVERNSGYTVMSNHHLRNKELTLKAKGLLSQMLSLPEDWDYRLVLCDAGGGRENLHPFGNGLESRHCIRQRKPDAHAGELLCSRSAERK